MLHRLRLTVLLLLAFVLASCDLPTVPEGVPADTTPPDWWLDPDADEGSDAAAERDTGTTPDATPDAEPIGDVERADTAEGSDDTTLADTAAPLAPPEIVSVTPLRGSTSGGTSVFVEGAGFAEGIELFLGGRLLPRVDRIDDYTLSFLTEPSPAGPALLKLVTAGGSTTFEQPFVFLEDLVVEAVAPASGQLAGGYDLLVTGAGFGDATRFFLGSREAQVVRRLSTQAVLLEAPPGGSAGAVEVLAFDERLARLADGFTYRNPAQLSALLPSRAPTAGGLEAELVGAGLSEQCLLYFGAEAATLRQNGAGRWSATVPPGLPGTVDLALDCGEDGSDWLPDAFSYDDAASGTIVERALPDTLLAGGGEVVSLLGAGLEGVASVRVGEAEAVVLEATAALVRFLSPPTPAGPVEIQAFSEAGAYLGSAFVTFVELPDFARISPSSGSAAAGFGATLMGSGLAPVSSFFVGGSSLSLVENRGSAADLLLPPGAPGTAPLRARIGTLTLDTGLTVSWLRDRRFDPFFPQTGSAGGGSLVYLPGDGFTATCTLFFDGVAAPTQLRGTGLLAALAPAHAPGKVRIEVRGCGERTELPGFFRYQEPAVIPGGTSGGALQGEMRVSVLELGSNDPIEGATVQIGVREGEALVAVTDATGRLTFIDSRLRGPQTVTAFAAGRSTESLVRVDARDVTLMLNPLPPPPCEDPTDPACAPPAAEPLGTLIGFLTGLGKLGVPPVGLQPVAIVSTTRLFAGWVNPDPGLEAFRTAEGPFTITTRVGDYAAIAVCGYGNLDRTVFIPLRLGVTRSLSARPGGDPVRATIDCNIPLDRSLLIKLSSAPAIVEGFIPGTFPAQFAAHLAFSFGPEGYFEGLPDARTTQPVIVASGLPALDGTLENVRIDIRAGAYAATGTVPASVAYATGISNYDSMVIMPDLLGVPRFVVPADTATELTGGYVEWALGPTERRPDFYSISASAGNIEFSRWNIFVPGDQTSFTLADFPAFSAALGEIAGPAAPSVAFNLYLRAIDVDLFDFDDFTRRVFRQEGWRASATIYRNLVFALPTPVTP
jgi:hypothetical protein